MRDDFPEKIKQILAQRAGGRCSNPECQRSTSGPRTGSSKSISIGVAAHVTAAARDGPRYNPEITPQQRSAPENGIWLCQACAKLVDNDPARYTVEYLQEWKRTAEERARRELESLRAAFPELGDHRPLFNHTTAAAFYTLPILPGRESIAVAVDLSGEAYVPVEQVMRHRDVLYEWKELHHRLHELKAALDPFVGEVDRAYSVGASLDITTGRRLLRQFEALVEGLCLFAAGIQHIGRPFARQSDGDVVGEDWVVQPMRLRQQLLEELREGSWQALYEATMELSTDLSLYLYIADENLKARIDRLCAFGPWSEPERGGL